MAIIPKDTYPGQTIAGDPGYPHGKARNITTPGDGTGTPWEEQGVNDIYGFLQSLLARGGVTPSGAPDKVGASDYVDALDNAYKQTLQDAYDASVAAGDIPTIQSQNASPHLTINGILEMSPQAGYTECLWLNGTTPIVLRRDGQAFRVGPGAGMSTSHGITTPANANTASKAALVREAGTGQQATEWMPMDWGDTDGGGSGWAPNITGSGATVTEGRWSRVGNVITFSISGTATLTGSGTSYGATFTFDPPPGASDPHAQLTSADIVKGVPNFMAAFSDPASVTGTLGHDSNIGVMPWVIAGTAKA